MQIDHVHVDEALTTTRSVRRRLDLDRPVDNQIIFDCIDVAEQAPSGGNQSSRRWMIVRDAQIKQRLAELYMEPAGRWMIDTRDRLARSGHPQERVMASAAHLAEHLAAVPAIVIPTIIGTYDGSGKPGLFDSVIQAAWSFCVAARARGLGTAWTTAILHREAEIAELLDVPDGITQIAMLPVAWTKGTDFRRAPRLPARQVAYVDSFGRTWERGPNDPPSFADGPGTVVETDIKAPIDDVWAIVADIGVNARFSDELVEVRWVDGFDAPAVGARFVGVSEHRAIGRWETTCYIDRYVEGREVGWATRDPDRPGARWRFHVSSIAGGSRLRHSAILGPGPSGLTAAIEQMPDNEAELIDRRLREHRENMRRVVEGIAAEAIGTSGAR